MRSIVILSSGEKNDKKGVLTIRSSPLTKSNPNTLELEITFEQCILILNHHLPVMIHMSVEDERDSKGGSLTIPPVSLK